MKRPIFELVDDYITGADTHWDDVATPELLHDLIIYHAMEFQNECKLTTADHFRFVVVEKALEDWTSLDELVTDRSVEDIEAEIYRDHCHERYLLSVRNIESEEMLINYKSFSTLASAKRALNMELAKYE